MHSPIVGGRRLCIAHKKMILSEAINAGPGAAGGSNGGGGGGGGRRRRQQQSQHRSQRPRRGRRRRSRARRLPWQRRRPFGEAPQVRCIGRQLVRRADIGKASKFFAAKIPGLFILRTPHARGATPQHHLALTILAKSQAHARCALPIVRLDELKGPLFIVLERRVPIGEAPLDAYTRARRNRFRAAPCG